MEPRRHHRYNENKGIPFNQSCREDWVNGPPRTFARVAKCIAPPLERQSVGLWPTAKTLEAIQCICTVAVRVKCKKCSQISEIIADGVQHTVVRMSNGSQRRLLHFQWLSVPPLPSSRYVTGRVFARNVVGRHCRHAPKQTISEWYLLRLTQSTKVSQPDFLSVSLAPSNGPSPIMPVIF